MNSIEYDTLKMPNAQRAVWRKRGSGSPESLCKFANFAPVRTAVEAPPAPSRWNVVCHMGTVRWAREVYDKFRQNYRKLEKTE